MDKVYFATGNAGKVEEMEPLFRERGFELEQVEVDIDEIDALDVEDVAERKVVDSYEAAGVDGLLIVEDTGLYVDALDGFPGAKVSFFDSTVGAEGLLDLMEGEDNRSAYFKTAIASYDGDQVRLFVGRVPGRISREKRGDPNPHLPYDFYFMPEGSGETYAENPPLKDEVSHRKEATEKLLDWLASGSPV